MIVLKSGDGLRPAAPLFDVWRARAAASGTDDEDSSELRQGRKSKTRSPCRAGPFPSKKKNGVMMMMMFITIFAGD